MYLLSDSQFGFRSGKSVEIQLLKCYSQWITAIYEHKFIDIIYIDYAKAFDKVSHTKLLVKLCNIGISGNILSWIKSFLFNRSQQVTINNIKFDSVEIISGVPQGSVIGPFLFLIFINDLVDSIDTVINSNLFPDDTKLSLISNNINDRIKLQIAIDQFYNWTIIWQLENAAHKTACLTLGQALVTNFTINNNTILNCILYKDLGINFVKSLF